MRWLLLVPLLVVVAWVWRSAGTSPYCTEAHTAPDNKVTKVDEEAE